MAIDKGTPVGRAIGLGSSHHGVQHWLRQRVASLCNLFLGLWLVFSLILLPGLDFSTLHDWLTGPIPAIASGLLIVTGIWESRLGLQVVIEDYVHENGNKFAALAALNLAAVLGMAIGLYFTVRLIAAG
ncbi:MAG TPA: succinate dehydrogenase, hydrophobic membrane anchor protein [Novosphingobium sp.]|nr:succinate dehydrogenase, hydrophobic membrane anchor protein [Novosphingobium sp.]